MILEQCRELVTRVPRHAMAEMSIRYELYLIGFVIIIVGVSWGVLGVPRPYIITAAYYYRCPRPLRSRDRERSVRHRRKDPPS